MANKRQQKKNQKKLQNQYQFPVGKKTLEEYQRQVRNTRAKVNRVKRVHNIDLTDEVEIPKLEEFSSRKEFNRWVEKQERFRSRSNPQYQFVRNEYGVSASKQRLREIEKKVDRARKLADEEIKKYEDTPFVSGGKQQSTIGMQRPNKTGIYKPEPFDFRQVRSERRLEEIEESAQRKSEREYYDERLERMKDNFIVALSGSFNSLADDLINAIKDIPDDDFYQMYLMFDEFDFDYFDTEGQLVTADETSVGQMMKYVKMYENGDLDSDLWHENFR